MNTFTATNQPSFPPPPGKKIMVAVWGSPSPLEGEEHGRFLRVTLVSLTQHG